MKLRFLDIIAIDCMEWSLKDSSRCRILLDVFDYIFARGLMRPVVEESWALEWQPISIINLLR